MEKWEASSVFAENLMDAHACFREERVSLGGKWRFLCQSADLPLPEGWETPDFPDKKWRRIPVPGSWEQSEVCESFYRGATLPGAFSGAGSPMLDQSQNLVGLYRRSFILSKDQGSRQIILRFASVSSCALVWVNGIYIGMSKGSRTDSEFDITSAVRPEKNYICVQVHRYSDVTPLEPEGRWLTSGILGDVELYTLPARRITDITAGIRWRGNSTPLLDLKVAAQNADGFTARIALMDDKGVVGYCESEISGDAASAVIPCKNVKLWCAESPSLYKVAVILWDGVAMYHTRQIAIGFRRVSLEGNALYINGRPEKLLGLSYHPFDPQTGCVPGAKQLETDLKTIRDHNFNTIQVEGSVPDTLYEICDRLGLYVLSNFGILESKTHAEYTAFQHRRIRDAFGSHPSIIAWDQNSESPGILSMDDLYIGQNHSLSQLKRMLGQEVAPESTGGFRRRNAPGPEIDPRDYAGKPILAVLSEAAHLAEYNALIRSADQLCGCLFGSFRDRMFLGKAAPGEAMGFAASDGMLRPAIREAKAVFQPVHCTFGNEMLTIENRSRFLSTSAFNSRYILTLDGYEFLSKPLEVSIAPGETMSIPLETKYDIYKPGRYHLSVEFRNREDGRVVASDQWPVGHLKQIYDENPGGTIREDSGTIYLRSQEASYIISRATGNLEQILIEERELLAQPMYPVYSDRSPAGSGLRIPDEWEKLTQRRKKPKPSVLEVDHMTRTVTASFHLGSGMMQTYRLFSDGSLAVELRLRTGRTAPDKLGAACILPDSFHRFRWFGLGPDDGRGSQEGRFFGIHSQHVTTESGTKDSVYSLSLTDDTGTSIHVRCEDGLRASAHAGEGGTGTCLTLELAADEPPKPHTTYTLAFTLRPVK